MARPKFEPRLTAFLHDMPEAILRSVAEGQECPENDEQTEMRICALYLIFEKSASKEHLERAIHWTERWTVASFLHHPDRDRRFDILGMLLARMCQCERLEEVVPPAPLGQLMDHESLSDDMGFRRKLFIDRVAKLLVDYKQSKHTEDLNKAIGIVAQLVHENNRYSEPELWNDLVVMFQRQFHRTGVMEGIARAIGAPTEAVDVTRQCDPNLAGYLNIIGNKFGKRFETTGAVEDLDLAVDATYAAMLSTPQGDARWISYLNNLGSWLAIRFDETGAMEDLNCTINLASSAVDLIPQDHPQRAKCLNTLHCSLNRRYNRTVSKEDLDRAVDAASKAVDAASDDTTGFAHFSDNLSVALALRSHRMGVMEDLDDAIVASTGAVRATPKGDPELAIHLYNLSDRLKDRFKSAGAMKDLDRAVDAAKKSVAITPPDNTYLPTFLSNYGDTLGLRFERTGALDDLQDAIENMTKAAKATPQGGTTPGIYLNALGLLLGKQFEKTGVQDDIDHAIRVITKAVDMTPTDHPDRAIYMKNLGNQFGRRFEKTGSMEDLDRGVENVSGAVGTMPKDHPGCPSLFNNLGNWLGKRFERANAEIDLDQQLIAYTAALYCKATPPSIWIRSAGSAANVIALDEHWESASVLLEKAVNLLPKISPRYQTHTDRQDLLAWLYSLASMAAATALSANKGPYNALRLLELGRGLIPGLLMDIRTDVSDLERAYPDLAKRFVSLRDELDRPVDDGPRTTSSAIESLNWELRRERHHAVDQELNELIETIRTKPDFQTFLQSPTEAELIAAATPDPIIVVNVSFYRCDAFIIDRTGIQVVELPDLSQKRAEEWAANLLSASEDLTPLLEWLWHAICRPCLNALGLTSAVSDDNWPHVWWIPTGVLSQMPLHAAGYHGQGSTETVLDRTMSSYAVSIKSLLRGRRQDQNFTGKSPTPSALLVAMQETPWSRPLPYAGDEVDILRNLCPPIGLDPITPRLFKGDVLARLQRHTVFHFAGNALSNPREPSRSFLLLKDWELNPLTVQNLCQSQVQENRPSFAYLSTCSTVSNKNPRLSGEGIHLVSAFQLMGFRHVVGTLWNVSDEHRVDVARVFYETLLDEGMTGMTVCRAFHQTLRTLRDGYTRNPELLGSEAQRKGPVSTHWIPYVHFGA
ncbi:CHAT domain-containing protein [Ilyonectria sp. MPI-CAGE-AT-0026]|nr:CHAT domain-containing protein [Ilyonectria sp. MPI-CAGE-AT-0026]